VHAVDEETRSRRCAQGLPHTTESGQKSKEIYDRLEGKAPQELRFAGYAEPYSEERMIETRSEIHKKLMDFLARGDHQEDSAQSEPVKALPERT
jgi:hypothetical protein